MPYIKISKKNLFSNLLEIEKKVQSKEKIAVCLKNNAYGHGLELMAKLCSEYGIKRAVVANIVEARSIKKYFKHIITLSGNNTEVSSDNIELVINDIQDIKNIRKKSKVHLKIDTGMHRNGIMPKEINQAFKLIIKHNLNLVGVMTHFRSADILDSQLFWQNDIFQKCKKEVLSLCDNFKINYPLFSSANSSTVCRMNEYEDFVRVGISIYGYAYTSDDIHKLDLKPILSLYAKKVSSRIMTKNNKIGYGGCGKISKTKTINNYDIGYGDGFPRLNESHNYEIKEQTKIIGRVSMSNISISSDETIILLFNDVQKLAKHTNTIVYDILVKLSPYIQREVF